MRTFFCIVDSVDIQHCTAAAGSTHPPSHVSFLFHLFSHPPDPSTSHPLFKRWITTRTTTTTQKNYKKKFNPEKTIDPRQKHHPAENKTNSNQKRLAINWVSGMWTPLRNEHFMKDLRTYCTTEPPLKQ